jgi:hypothetical protein
MHSHQHAATSGGALLHDPDTLQPLALPLGRAVAVTGLSRSAVYRARLRARSLC